MQPQSFRVSLSSRRSFLIVMKANANKTSRQASDTRYTSKAICPPNAERLGQCMKILISYNNDGSPWHPNALAILKSDALHPGSAHLGRKELCVVPLRLNMKWMKQQTAKLLWNSISSAACKSIVLAAGNNVGHRRTKMDYII